MNVSDLNPLLVEAINKGTTVVIKATKLESFRLTPLGNRDYFNENITELLKRLNPSFKGLATYQYYSLERRSVIMSNSRPLHINCISSDEIFIPLEEITEC